MHELPGTTANKGTVNRACEKFVQLEQESTYTLDAKTSDYLTERTKECNFLSFSWPHVLNNVFVCCFVVVSISSLSSWDCVSLCIWCTYTFYLALLHICWTTEVTIFNPVGSSCWNHIPYYRRLVCHIIMFLSLSSHTKILFGLFAPLLYWKMVFQNFSPLMASKFHSF